MWEQLTANQQRGFKYAADLRNQQSIGGRTNWTPEEIALEKLRDAGNALRAELRQAVKDHVAAVWDTWTISQQLAVLQPFNLPQILKE